MEKSLSRNMEVERISRNLPGIKIVRGVSSFNHSQFVDALFYWEEHPPSSLRDLNRF